MDYKIKVTVSPYRRFMKPNMTNEWHALSYHTQPFYYSISDFANKVGNNGHSFSHANCGGTGEINTENFLSALILVLDFDGKDNSFSPQQVIEQSEEKGLKPNIIYRTFSDKTPMNLSTEEKLKKTKRFRVIFILDKPVTDVNFFDEVLRDGGYQLFPEADSAPHKVQIWAGGKELIYLDEAPRTSPLNLLCASDVYGAKNIKKRGRQERFKKKYGETQPDIFHNGMEREEDGRIPISANSYSNYKEIEKNGKKIIRGVDWVEIARESELFRDFYYKERKIYNPELLGLFSGMRRFEGGALLWKKLIIENSLIHNYHLGIEEWFKTQFAKGKNPWEQQLSVYAPNDIAGNQYVRLTDIHFKRGNKAIKLKTTLEIPIKEAHMKMQIFIKKFLDSDDIKFAVCKAATALGKTKFILENVREGCLICVPTHDLGSQHANDLKKLGVEFLTSPEVPTLPEPIQMELDRYYSAGDNIGAARFLKRMSRDFKSYNYGLSGKESIELQKILTKYYDDLKRCTESSLPVIITHKRLLFTEFPNHHTIIIDEDIIPALFETGSFTTKDLRHLINSLRRSDYLGQEKDLAVLEGLLNSINNDSQLFRHIQTTSGGRTEIFENFQEIIDCAHRVGNKLEGQILPFFSCDYYIVDFEDEDDPEGERVVLYLIKHQLPSDKKVLVLSATANKFMYEKIFGNIHWLDLSHIQHKGKRIQFSDLSHSRSTIASKNNKKSLDLIRDFIGDTMPKITFKKYRYLFKNPASVYLENCSGYNEYTGQDIAVIGTPHIPTHVYRLMAAALGIEFTADDFKLESQWVKYNGYKFRFMTFSHQGLRNIQFYFIESALVQACGRNRSLRKDATIYLFSNFPLAGFEQHSTKELEDWNVFNLESKQEYELPMGMPSGSMAS